MSSFVRPHPGGVEEFVDSARAILEDQGMPTRVLACRLAGLDGSADAVVSARFIGSTSWPFPTGGWRTLWREITVADVVVANGARHVLPVLAAVLARTRRRPALLVLHGSGEGPHAGSQAFRVARSLFERTVGRASVRLAHPVSVSRAGVEGARRLYGVQASYLPYPLRRLPSLAVRPGLSAGEPLRVAWVGRLFPEKDPLLAVAALDSLHSRRDAVLEVCGDGVLRPELHRLGRERTWLLIHGARRWEEVQALQAGAHACLATSVADNVQVAVLEALCRAIPTVATEVGDAPAYYLRPAIRHLCVAPRDAAAVSDALFDLAVSYDAYSREFAANAELLREKHAAAGDALARLVLEASRRGAPAAHPSSLR